MTPHVVTNSHEERARIEKAAKLYDYCLAENIDSETLKLLDDAGWEALRLLAGTHKPSATTRGMVIERLSKLERARAKNERKVELLFEGRGE